MSQSVEESIGEMALLTSEQKDWCDVNDCFEDEAGHEPDPPGCECGCGPTLDSWTAFNARRAFQGLPDGLCDPCEDHEIEEPTYRHLKHVKECIEHVCVDAMSDYEAKWQAKLKANSEWHQHRLDLAETNVRVLERALRKAGVDVEEVDYATHSDSESECCDSMNGKACSESELSVPADHV